MVSPPGENVNSSNDDEARMCVVAESLNVLNGQNYVVAVAVAAIVGR